MKLQRSKEWWIDRARREGDAVVGAGLVARDPAPESRSLAAGEETRIAFGRFVHLMRRRRGYSMEQLAERADLEPSELLVIEDDVHYVPGPRTVYKLAETFEVPQQRLMQLAGLAAANDAGLAREAVRFAARSESIEKLTAEESAALEAFVAVLSERDPKRIK